MRFQMKQLTKIISTALFALTLFLEKSSFKIDDVLEIAECIREKYKKLLNHTGDRLIEDYGEILKVLNEVDKDFNTEMTPIVKKIKRLNSKCR